MVRKSQQRSSSPEKSSPLQKRGTSLTSYASPSSSSEDEYFSDEYIAPETSSDDEDYEEPSLKKSRDSERELIKCPICRLDFSQLSSLKEHVSKVYGIAWRVLESMFPGELQSKPQQMMNKNKESRPRRNTSRIRHEEALAVLDTFLGNFKESTRSLYKRNILKLVEFLASNDPRISLVSLLDPEHSRMVLIPPELIDKYLATLDQGYPVINNIKAILALESLILIKVAKSNHERKDIFDKILETRNILTAKLNTIRRTHLSIAKDKKIEAFSNLEKDAFVKNPEEFLEICFKLLRSRYFKKVVKNRELLHPQILRDVCLYSLLIESQGQRGTVLREMRREEFAHRTHHEDGILSISVKETQTVANGESKVLFFSKRVRKLLETHYSQEEETSCPYMFSTVEKEGGSKLRDLRAPIQILIKHLVKAKLIEEGDERFKDLSSNVIRKAFASVASKDRVLKGNMPYLLKTGKKQGVPDSKCERQRIIYKRFQRILFDRNDALNTSELLPEETSLLKTSRNKSVRPTKRRKLPSVSKGEINMLKSIFMINGKPSITDIIKKDAQEKIPAYRKFKKKFSVLDSRALTKKIRLLLLHQR